MLLVWTGLLLLHVTIVLAYKNAVITMGVDRCVVKGDDWRFDCIPQGKATQKECEKRNCCWKAPAKPLPPSPSGLTVPNCYFPNNFPSYIITSTKSFPQGLQMNASLNIRSPYPQDINTVVAEFIFLSKTTLRIRITDADHARWEPPLRPEYRKESSLSPSSSSSSSSKPSPLPSDADANTYVVKLSSSNEPLGFKVLRNTGEILFETAGGFIYSDQFLQLSSNLPSSFLYGLGEHRQKLMVSTNWTRLTMWNRGHVPQENTNLYGSHPFYICKDSKGWHGVFLHNSNAMDIIVQPAPAITWRAIGGIFDFYIFTGPTLQNVVAQYTELVGRTFMPPYWALGFHLCWQSYGTANNTLKTMDRLRHYGIPQDVQWNDIDYAEKARVFTTDKKNFGDQALLAKEIHAREMHYIIMVDCGICNSANPGSYLPFDLGVKMGIFINDTDGKPLIGKVWPGTTVWPDFLNEDSQTYWTSIAKEFHDKVPFDGMWVDMNEITNFIDGSVKGCDPNSTLDEPPYLPAVVGGKLYAHSICPSAQHKMGSHYNIHNLYGYYETYRSFDALRTIRQKRPFVISRSTYSGQGHYGGHWTGDNKSSFYDMYKSISALLHANMFGISVSGSDICGFNLNTTAELCTRWHQLGAFYVFARNHNAQGNIAQDPGQFGDKSAASTQKVLLIRYSLLPYLYTLLYRSHVFGDTVARPLMFEFPEDPRTYDLDFQFLWGAALMISPVLHEDERTVTAYFPKDHWYDFYTGEVVKDTGQYVHLDAPLDVINIHLRGGYILPMQKPELTTTLSRKNPLWLLVALPGMYNQSAVGEVYLDDGDSLDAYEEGFYTLINFTATQCGMSSNTEHLGYTSDQMILNNVIVFGLAQQPSEVTLNGSPVDFTYKSMVLYIPSLHINMSQSFSLKWGNSLASYDSGKTSGIT